MNERAWFTLMVRGFGLYLLISGFTQLTPSLANFFRPGVVTSRPAGGGAGGALVPTGPQISWLFWQSLAPLAIFALGAYFFFGGSWLIDRLCREVVDRCRRCGYDLREAPAGVCPECGSALKPPAKPGGGPS
jgi:hypothetical protein